MPEMEYCCAVSAGDSQDGGNLLQGLASADRSEASSTQIGRTQDPKTAGKAWFWNPRRYVLQYYEVNHMS